MPGTAGFGEEAPYETEARLLAQVGSLTKRIAELTRERDKARAAQQAEHELQVETFNRLTSQIEELEAKIAREGRE